MSPPLAFFLTWTCYGSWLHGDARGSVDKIQNHVATPYRERSVLAERAALGRMQSPEVVLSIDMRRMVRDCLIEHCVFRGVHMHAISVRTNHVHLITSVGVEAPAILASRFKARATRSLREAGYLKATDRAWTRHTSTRFLWNTEDLLAAKKYVLHEQGEPDEFTVDGK